MDGPGAGGDVVKSWTDLLAEPFEPIQQSPVSRFSSRGRTRQDLPPSVASRPRCSAGGPGDLSLPDMTSFTQLRGASDSVLPHGNLGKIATPLVSSTQLTSSHFETVLCIVSIHHPACLDYGSTGDP